MAVPGLCITRPLLPGRLSIKQGRLSGNDRVKMLPGLKVQYSWIKEVGSTALQSSVKNMDGAYQNFFASKSGSRKGEPVGFPKFKAKHHCRDSFTCKVGFAVQDGAVKLPKLGWIRAKTSTVVKGYVLNATVSITRSGKFFVSICCTDADIPQLPTTGATVGLDVGIKDLVITSDGVKYPNHMYLAKNEKKLGVV